jgi:hypothetical protein
MKYFPCLAYWIILLRSLKSQDIPDIGKILKLIYDDKKVKPKIIATVQAVLCY